jgi:Tfp pilus assembly protein PilZ
VVRHPDGSLRNEYLVNVSVSGLCLHMRLPVSVGEELWVAFRLPSDADEIQAGCKVVWTTHEGEIHPAPRFFETGLFLPDVDEIDRRRIEAFVLAQVIAPELRR